MSLFATVLTAAALGHIAGAGALAAIRAAAGAKRRHDQLPETAGRSRHVIRINSAVGTTWVHSHHDAKAVLGAVMRHLSDQPSPHPTKQWTQKAHHGR